MSINIDLLLRETVSPIHADVYSMQRNLNENFAGDYHIAYAYGNENSPREVHERVAASGAEQLGMPVEDYLRLWEESVECILQFHDVPAQFQDERYLLES